MSEKGIQSLPADVTRQLQVLTRSQWFIMVTVCAILLSYYSVSLMKQKLVCTATDPALCKCLPETLPIQTFPASDPACPYLLCGPLWENRLFKQSSRAIPNKSTPHLSTTLPNLWY